MQGRHVCVRQVKFLAITRSAHLLGGVCEAGTAMPAGVKRRKEGADVFGVTLCIWRMCSEPLLAFRGQFEVSNPVW